MRGLSLGTLGFRARLRTESRTTTSEFRAEPQRNTVTDAADELNERVMLFMTNTEPDAGRRFAKVTNRNASKSTKAQMAGAANANSRSVAVIASQAFIGAPT